MQDDTLTLRSYRPAFELERRIHRIDRFRIPVPYGVPLLGIAYAAGAAVIVGLASSLPVSGALLGALPLPVRLLFVPVAAAHLLCRMRSDGRPAHEAILSRIQRRLTPPRLVALAPSSTVDEAELQAITVVADERGPAYRRGIVRGPAIVLLRLPARGEVHRRTLAISRLPGPPLFRGYELRLGRDQRLAVR